MIKEFLSKEKSMGRWESDFAYHLKEQIFKAIISVFLHICLKTPKPFHCTKKLGSQTHHPDVTSTCFIFHCFLSFSARAPQSFFLFFKDIKLSFVPEPFHFLFSFSLMLFPQLLLIFHISSQCHPDKFFPTT